MSSLTQLIRVFGATESLCGSNAPPEIRTVTVEAGSGDGVSVIVGVLDSAGVAGGVVVGVVTSSVGVPVELGSDTIVVSCVETGS
jgi:hypothetical protein